MNLTEVVTNIFGSSFHEPINLQNNESFNKDSIDLQQIIKVITEKFGTELNQENVNKLEDSRSGRLGPKLVILDTSTHHGLFIVSPDRLSVIAQSNFGTMRANTGVYQGKWMYEVQLGSKGVMQLGWSTIQCKFSKEFGVGDVVNSYAFDGNRMRKWNISTHQYGESWLSGDIIGCAIDMEEGTMSFYRNGKDLGVAFSRISMGPGIVYFPTVSLALAENLTANFGITPMRYPLKDYQLIQEAPVHQLENAEILFGWFEKLLYEYKNIDNLCKDKQTISNPTFMACLARCILKQMGPLLEIPYVTQEIFIPLIKKLAKDDISMLKTCLDLIWTFLESHEIKICFETVVAYLSSVFRQVSVQLEYLDQCTTLSFLNSLCQHVKTRQYLLQYILFDKVKFANFVHVKPLDEDCLNKLVDEIWWETEPTDASIESCKNSYMSACEKIRYAISEVEALQVELLITLLNNTDGNATTHTSREIFLRKFRNFVQENLLSSRSEFLQPMAMYQTPLPITLCCFHRLLVAFRTLWDAEVGTDPICIPYRSFCDSTINYTGIDRLGGVLSHLNKAYRNDLVALLGPDHQIAPEPETTNLVANLFGSPARIADAPVISVFARTINMNSVNIGGTAILERIGYFPYTRDYSSPMQNGILDPKASLIELLDGIILFYHATAKKQISKVAYIRDLMSDYVLAMADTKKRLESIKNLKDQESLNVQLQLMKTMDIFKKKLTEQARHMAWVRAVVFSEEKQERIVWLLRTVILTLNTASQSGNLFSFVPEFYLKVLADMITGLRNHIHPTVPIETIPNYKGLLQDVAEFLCNHFLDPRIVNANSKDTLIFVLAGFASNPMTLEALESVPRESRRKMVSNLLRSYENRAWAQSNWILVRFWQGHGFAFRYDKSPHVIKKMGPNIISQETIEPYPSLIYQSHVKDVLLGNNQGTTLFLNSLLNQLNWAFSEFIGNVQEIHNISARPDRALVESRQLRICATCFDLAVALLRVLEMIASVATDVFTDFSLTSTEGLLARLCQLLCQILNRISMQTSSFQHVVLLDIPDLQSVDHFPILTAVIGIIIALLKEDMSLPESDEIPRVTKAFITEPSFQMGSLNFVLGDVKSTKVKNVKTFSFLNYENDVSPVEIESVKRMISHIDFYRTKLSLAETPCSDDDLCTICYAFPISVVFKPCNHSSCRACIDRHLLNNRNCFLSVLYRQIFQCGNSIFYYALVYDKLFIRITRKYFL